MLQPAFSTVACPEWTIDSVFENAQAAGYLGVELRTFGPGSRGAASDPALMAPEKVRALAERTGVKVCSLGTSCRFDQPVWPPVIGYATCDTERSIRDAKWHIDLAITLECPLVRVFAFDPPPRESTAAATGRIAQRLKLVVAHAHRTGVRIALENGGRYSTAAQLMAIIDQVDSPLLGVCYNAALAHACGESPENGINVLGEKLLALRIKDYRDGAPCRLGDGVMPMRDAVTRLARQSADVPVIFEWDRAWTPESEPAQQVLGPAAKTMYEWIRAGAPAPKVPARV